jgi:hypothetical protein
MAQQMPLRDALYLRAPQLRPAIPSVLSSSARMRSPFGRPCTALSAWSSFNAEVEEFIEEQTNKFPHAMVYEDRCLRPDKWSQISHVSTETCVQQLFNTQILTVVSDVLKVMECPGYAANSTSAIVYGFPDRIWSLEEDALAVMCFEVKTPWYLKDVTNIVDQCSSHNCDQRLRASIEQIYGYMSVSSRANSFENMARFLSS